jgi:membrane-bound inhibitor of C-type lysozyme
MCRVLSVFASAAAVLAAAVAASASAQEASPDTAIAHVKFTCTGDKWIDATFFPEKVDLTLSDGRTMSVPQAMSASGARYANADESFVFWNKGDTAFVTEGTDPNAAPTFADCTDITKKT